MKPSLSELWSLRNYPRRVKTQPDYDHYFAVTSSRWRLMPQAVLGPFYKIPFVFVSVALEHYFDEMCVVKSRICNPSNSFSFCRTGKGTEFFSGWNQSNTCGKSKFFNFSKLHVIKKMGYQRRKKCYKYAKIIFFFTFKSAYIQILNKPTRRFIQI